MDRSNGFFVVLIVIIATGCAAEKAYRDRLIPDSKNEVQKNPYGAYIELKTSSRKIEGELISITRDSIYIMTYSELQNTSNLDIISFEIYLTQNGAKKYLRRSAIGLIPAVFGSLIYPDYAGGFLTVGLFGSVWGGLAALVESTREATILTGPSNPQDLSEYWKYSRFPQGVPEKYDLRFLPVPINAKK